MTRGPESGGGDSSEGIELVWPGKYVDGERAPLGDHGAKLRERELIGDEEAATGATVIAGDNLLVLEALVREEPGSVDLVYIDPPFATGNRFALSRRIGDKARGDEQELRLPAFDDAWEGGVAGFLRMLDPRLRLIHQLLAPTGSLYVHVDPTVGHAVKLLLDEIFGPRSFQREIVWRIGWISGFKTQANNWIRNHDLIFFYTKDPRSFVFNKTWVPHPKGYARRKGRPAKAPGVAIEDVWNANPSEAQLSGRASLDSIQIKSFSREKTGWATQKNESLLARIIEASSNPGDRVADFFAGSGTTAAAAARLGRRFVICDHAEAAAQISRQRLLEQGVSDLRVLELDGRELQLAREAAGPELREWMLDQLEADRREAQGPFAGFRGEVGLVLGMPGEPIDGATLAEIAAELRARGDGPRKIEILAFEWAEPLDTGRVDALAELVMLQAGRGLFEPSVRSTSALAGGVAVWERAQIVVEIEALAEPGRVRVELRDLRLRRPERLPAQLRGRPFGERVLGWSVADAAAPTRPIFVASRSSREDLSFVAEIHAPDARALVVTIEELRGHRLVQTISLAGAGARG